MPDLSDLYQELILDHNRSPRNRGRLRSATSRADGFNPLCGDRVSLTLRVDGSGVISDVAFEGNGCAISTASASLMTQAVKGRPVTEARDLFRKFHDLLTCVPQAVDAGTASEGLGKLAAFAGVRRFPARVKCATLAWHTLRAALDRTPEPVTTE